MRGKVDDLIAGLVGFVSALGPVQEYVSLNRIIKKCTNLLTKEIAKLNTTPLIRLHIQYCPIYFNDLSNMICFSALIFGKQKRLKTRLSCIYFSKRIIYN